MVFDAAGYTLDMADEIRALPHQTNRGAVADLDNTGADVVGMRTAFELLAADPRIEATVVQTVGVKGYDGFAFGVVSA